MIEEKRNQKSVNWKKNETKWLTMLFIIIWCFIENENNFFVLNFIYFSELVVFDVRTLITIFCWKGSRLFGKNETIFRVKFAKVFCSLNILSIILKRFWSVENSMQNNIWTYAKNKTKNNHWTFEKYHILCFLIYCRIRSYIERTFRFSIACNEASIIIIISIHVFSPVGFSDISKQKAAWERKKKLLFL